MQRLYNEYHKAIIDLTKNILSSYDIDFAFIDRQSIKRKNLSIEPNCELLVVWSEDALKDDIMFDHNGADITKSLDMLQNLQVPVLWLTAVENAALDFQVPQNIDFLHYGGDIMFGMTNYQCLQPQREKNLASKHTWISLNHAPKLGRILTACCLLGHGLGDQTVDHNHGLLRISPDEVKDYLHWQDYLQEHYAGHVPVTQQQKWLLQHGFVKLQKNFHGGQPAGNIYETLVGLDNAGNFDRSLRYLYQDSLLEIVNESLFFNRGIFVTEKFQNSVYGFNLPIVMSVPRTVDYLRSNGFDMFDDVVDHSYDLLSDPVQKIFCAIENNLRLFTDPGFLARCYKHCLPRLEKNYQYIKNDMYQHFQNRFQDSLVNYILSKKGGHNA